MNKTLRAIPLLFVLALLSMGISCQELIDNYDFSRVVITSPEDGTVYTGAHTVTLQVAITPDLADYVTKVEFFDHYATDQSEGHGTPSCTDSRGPDYTCEWSFTADDNRSHYWNALAHFDNGQAPIFSAPVELVVDIGNGTESTGTPHFVGLIPTAGTARDVAVDRARNLAFVASDEFGLTVFDIANPREPVGVGAPIPSFKGNDVGLAAGNRVVVTSVEGLFIVDVSNAALPETVGFLEGNFRGLVTGAQGQFAYTLLSSSGVAVVDLRNPTSPSIVAQVSTPVGSELERVGSRLYAITGSGLEIFDVTSPLAPYSVGAVAVPSNIKALTIDGSYAYVGNSAGTTIINIGNPAHPVVVGSAPIAAGSFAASNGTLYNVAGDYLSIFSLATPGSPLLVSTSDGFRSRGIEVIDGTAFLVSSYVDFGTGEGGLYLVDVATPASPALLGQAPVGVGTSGIAASESLVVTVSVQSGLYVVDVTNPSRPERVGFLEGSFRGVAMGAQGQFAYVLVSSIGLAVIDLRDPTQPAIVSQVSAIVGNNVERVGSRVYAITGSGLEVFDVSNPFNPTSVGAVSVPSGIKSLAVSGNHAYVGNTSSVTVVDISNRSHPVVVGSTTGAATALTVTNGRLFAVSGNNFRIFSLENPAAPVLLSTSAGYQSQGVHVVGNLAFLASPVEGVAIVDISEASAPELVMQLQVPGKTFHVAGAGNHVYVGDDVATVDIFRVN